MPAARPAGKAITSKLLVVDASVMRAAGGEAATDPAPAHARDTLKTILTICHRVFPSPDLSDEWKRHQSRFARGWLTRMYARGKVIRREPPARDEILADIRSFHAITQLDIVAIEKDLHLISAALAADQIVLSRDDQMAAIIRKICGDTRTLTSKAVGHILWINPIADRDPLHGWLSEIGPPRPHWRLALAALPAPVARRSGGRPTQRGKR